jgi:hypothetical protein
MRRLRRHRSKPLTKAVLASKAHYAAGLVARLKAVNAERELTLLKLQRKLEANAVEANAASELKLNRVRLEAVYMRFTRARALRARHARRMEHDRLERDQPNQADLIMQALNETTAAFAEQQEIIKQLSTRTTRKKPPRKSDADLIKRVQAIVDGIIRKHGPGNYVSQACQQLVKQRGCYHGKKWETVRKSYYRAKR